MSEDGIVLKLGENGEYNPDENLIAVSSGDIAMETDTMDTTITLDADVSVSCDISSGNDVETGTGASVEPMESETVVVISSTKATLKSDAKAKSKMPPSLTALQKSGTTVLPRRTSAIMKPAVPRLEVAKKISASSEDITKGSSKALAGKQQVMEVGDENVTLKLKTDETKKKLNERMPLKQRRAGQTTSVSPAKSLGVSKAVKDTGVTTSRRIDNKKSIVKDKVSPMPIGYAMNDSDKSCIDQPSVDASPTSDLVVDGIVKNGNDSFSFYI